MSTTCHACAIDAYSTAIASIAYDTDYAITECRTVRVGIGDFSGPNGDRAAQRIASLFRKQKIENLALSIQTPRFFPLDTASSRNISNESFDTHCRAEASFLLNKPGEYMHEHIPYTARVEEEPVRKHLLFYYPSDVLEEVCRKLRAFYPISNRSHYLKPMILSIAATCQPFILLELEHEYLTFSAGSNGELEYFNFWQLSHGSDAEYFALRELASNQKHRNYPVYITGNLAADKSLSARISNAAGTSFHPFSLAELFAMQRNVRSSCNSPVELKALSAALVNLYEQHPS